MDRSRIIRRCFRRAPDRDGLTILELLVAISIIGLVAGLLLPAIGAARESARRMQCVNHLRQIGIALHNHHDAIGHLPTGWQFDPGKTSAYGWAVPLLPYFEQDSLAAQIDRQKPIQHPANALARRTELQAMLCPSDLAEPTFVLFEGDEDEDDDEDALHTLLAAAAPGTPLVELPTANYVGVFGTIEADDSVPAPLGDGTFLENRSTRFAEFRRGLSQTIIVGERTMAQVPSTWLGICLSGEDAAARIVGSTLEGINNPLADEADFSSRHPGGANFLWADGHVRFVAETVDLREYHRWAQLHDAQH